MLTGVHLSRPILCASAAAFILIIAASSGATGADDAGNRSRKHKIFLGSVHQSTDMELRATARGFSPVTIDLDDLGVSESDNSYYLDYRYRFKPRWQLLVGAYNVSGNGGRSSSRDFNYDGVTFEAGTAIQGDFDVTAYIVDIMYSVHRTDRLELMLGGGIHALDLDVSIAAALRVDDQQAEVRRAGAALLAPVPNLRGSIAFQLSRRFELSLVGGWLSANVDEYDGDFLYGHLRASYESDAGFGVSVGYQVTDVDIEQSRNNGTLAFDARIDGPTLTLTYAF